MLHCAEPTEEEGKNFSRGTGVFLIKEGDGTGHQMRKVFGVEGGGVVDFVLENFVVVSGDSFTLILDKELVGFLWKEMKSV